MLLFVKQKIVNKKWLNLCLLAGIIFLTAVFSCYPMMAEGAGNQLLLSAFNDSAQENQIFPAAVIRTSGMKADNMDDAEKYLHNLENKWTSALNVPASVCQEIISLEPMEVASQTDKEKHYFRPIWITDLENRSEIVKGISLEEAADTDYGENVFPCLISEYTMDTYELAVNETLTTSKVELNGKPITYLIVGIFREKEDDSNYWYDDTNVMERAMFVSEQTLDTFWQSGYTENISYTDNMMLDYTWITYEKTAGLIKYVEAEKAAESTTKYTFYDILTSCRSEIASARTVLWVLALPCVVLLLLFIYMVSSQILSSEEGEIAVMRSRGMTRSQIVLLYLLQSLILSLIGGTIGILLGWCIGKLAAHMNGFMVFVMKDTRCYRFTWLMIPFALIGCAAAILFMTIPVFAKARVTIVQQKSTQKYVKKQIIWERFFLDIILLALSLYLLYNYNRQLDSLASDIASGASLDPVLFLDVSLFILAGALVFTRLIRYLLLLVDRIGKKKWKPAAYASFLELTRNYGSRIFISVFLIMTIACGIFDADMARTINQNKEDRITLDTGCDVRFREKWQLTTVEGDTGDSWFYNEPNIYDEYQAAIDAGIVSSMTRVMGNQKGIVNGNGAKLTDVEWMAINTKEFGETADLMDGLNDEHWYNALNALASETDGVILSENLAAALNVEVGDSVRFTIPNPSDQGRTLGTISGHVTAIVKAFPSYDCYSYDTAEDGSLVKNDHYLLICNYAAAIETFTQTPYSIWCRLAEGSTSDDLKQWLKEEGIGTSYFTSRQTLLDENNSSAMIQATNGMFTISFLFSLAVCTIGFLIYWIMSLRSRELLFGIYRAMGLRMSELRQMLLIEQIFGSLLPILAGGITGLLSTALFTRLIAVVYLPESHTIPLQIHIQAGDMIQLFVIIAVMVVVCFMILRNILKQMNIVQALKLGED